MRKSLFLCAALAHCVIANVLVPDAHGVADMSGMPCQNRSFEISDVAIFVKSSKAMCRDRIPASRAAYLEDAVARGARVAVMATECDDPLHVHVPLDVGARGCFWQSRGHCSLVARAYLAAAQNYSDGRAFTLIIDDVRAVVNLTNYARAMRWASLSSWGRERLACGHGNHTPLRGVERASLSRPPTSRG